MRQNYWQNGKTPLRLTGLLCSAAFGGSGYEKPHKGRKPTAVFRSHIFASHGSLRFPLSQPQKRRMQPERYVKWDLNISKNINNKFLQKWTRQSFFVPKSTVAGGIRAAWIFLNSGIKQNFLKAAPGSGCAVAGSQKVGKAMGEPLS